MNAAPPVRNWQSRYSSVTASVNVTWGLKPNRHIRDGA